MTTTDLHREFRSDGGAGKSAEAMAAFLDGAERLPAVQAIRAAMREALLEREAPPAEIALLDAACGTGTETRLLASRLCGRRVVGLDHNQAMLDIAAARAAGVGATGASGGTAGAAAGAAAGEPGIRPNGGYPAAAGTLVENPAIDWVCADVRATGLPDASVAAARIERGLIYLPDAEVAVAEFARLLAPGGVLVAYELDYGGLVLPVGDAPTELMREVNAVMEASLPAPWAGRRLAGWLERAGLTEVAVTPMNISAGPAVANRIVGDTIRTAVAEGRLSGEALEWLDAIALEPPALPAITVAGFLASARRRTRPGR